MGVLLTEVGEGGRVDFVCSLGIGGCNFDHVKFVVSDIRMDA